MNTVKPRYIVKQEYPFMSYKLHEIVNPTKKQIIEFVKYPLIFEDISIRYEVLSRNQNNEIISVKRLRDGIVFNIGDTVIYSLSWISYKIRFKIKGFNDSKYPHKDNISLYFFDSKNQLCEACGIGIVNQYDNKCLQYGTIKDLETA